MRAGLPIRGLEQRAVSQRERNALATAFQTGSIDLDGYARSLSAILRGTYSPQEIRSIHRAWIVEEYEGVGDVIDSIHEAGLHTACLSNTDHAHWTQIGGISAVSKLRTRMASHMLRLQKPDPAIFAEAERRLGLTGSAILYFDDLEENVAAARSAGWSAVPIDPLRRTDEQIARALREHDVIRSFSPERQIE